MKKSTSFSPGSLPGMQLPKPGEPFSNSIPTVKQPVKSLPGEAAI